MAYPISFMINTCSSIINTLNDICIQPQDKKQSHQYNLLLLFYSKYRYYFIFKNIGYLLSG